jgi:predicted ATPase
MEIVTVTLPDGTTVPLADARFTTDFSVKVALDGQVMDLGIAYRMLLTYRAYAIAELERLRTEVADLRAHHHHCAAVAEGGA